MSSTGAGANALTSLKNKMQSLKDESDKCKDQYEQKCLQLEAEKAERLKYENEVASLSRKLRLLEDEFEETGSRLQTTNEKLVELSKVSDESERARRALETRQNFDDDRINMFQRQVKDTTLAAGEAEKKYEEVARKLQLCESELERAEERAEAAESKAKSLDTEVHIATSTLKSLELNESKATKKEDSYETTIRELNARLKDVESRSSEAETKSTRLQRDVDRLESELDHVKTENKGLRDEMDRALQEIQSI